MFGPIVMIAAPSHSCMLFVGMRVGVAVFEGWEMWYEL